MHIVPRCCLRHNTRVCRAVEVVEALAGVHHRHDFRRVPATPRVVVTMLLLLVVVVLTLLLLLVVVVVVVPMLRMNNSDA